MSTEDPSKLKSESRRDSDSRAESVGSPADLRTEVQSEEAVAASAELSIPQHVRQDPTAPKAAGYVLTEKLGEGAYGQVWRAWQIRTRKEVAVKVFMQRSGLDWIFLQREVERLSRLDRHPHIVTLLDMGLDEDPPYYVMDIIDGGALQAYVRPDAPADPMRAVRWLTQICDALSYVHGKGLIHCDLKPANILVDGRDHVRVVDFGQSRVFTESAASMGTLFYMAPEQARLAEPGAPIQPDVRWDVYALGASLYAILTGRVPYAEGGSAEALESAPNLAERLERYRDLVAGGRRLSWDGRAGAALNPELVAIADKCMARDPDDRYGNVSELEQDLYAMRERRPVSPLARSTGYRAKKFLQRNPAKIGLAAAMVALVGAMVLGSIRQARLDRAEAAEIMALFVHSPADAVSRIGDAGDGTQEQLVALSDRFVASEAFTERVMGARAALLLDPPAFWESVDGGALWQSGEWLELIEAFGGAGFDSSRVEGPMELPAELEGGLRLDSARAQYVALCILGQLGWDRDGLADRCANLVRAADRQAGSPAPGVVMAASWAANRLGAGQPVRVPASQRVFVDDLTGLVFVQLPEAASFRPGSDESDPDRLADEDRDRAAVAIAPIHVASTELTLAGFAGYFTDAEAVASLAPGERSAILEQFGSVTPDEAMRVAIGGVSLSTARRFCEWLKKKAAQQGSSRTYRLPTEAEWEYAARAGNDGRFCFGSDAAYARYFAHCDGSTATRHEVGQRMPNSYGLFDMHGGLWEHTDSRYPPEHAPMGLQDKALFVRRGGAWYSPAVRCRSAQRNFSTADAVDAYTGVRLVMEPTP